MKYLFLILPAFFLITTNLCAQTDTAAAMQDIRMFQAELNHEYKDPAKSPLKAKASHFEGHQFFPADFAYRVEAKLVKTKKAEVFKMKTSSERTPDYRKYGDLHFELNGKPYKLEVYQSVDLIKKKAYRDYLFLPFTDLTTGDQTYGGGRYLDLRIPKGKTLILDFNKAYNPYCAYTSGYSCPVPPPQNFLNVSLEAGIKKPTETH